ncbi:FAD-dependent monooxygenase [Pokkaliibacter plantistimulans]|nr:FAD-dependent monooxygenase [Pokkaliibacter plantistimulans]
MSQTTAEVSSNQHRPAVVDVDIVIVGGGMVGAALAAALGNTAYRVVVLEQQLPEPFTAEQPHDLRVSAISVASQQLLAEVGAWSAILAMRACPYRRMRVWEEDWQSGTLFDSHDIQRDYLGHIIENRIVQLGLWQALEQYDNVEVICPASINQIDYDGSASTLTLDDGRSFHTSLLVGADGARSRVRDTAGIGVTAWEYPMHVLVANVGTVYSQQDITWQRFRQTGPEAFLPLSGPHASLVWYNTPQKVQELMAMDIDSLKAAFEQHFPAELGQIAAIEGRTWFPLKRQHAQSYVKPGIVLIGDAAHSIHPLAGQGVNLGFMDVMALRDVLREATPQSLREGAPLQDYEKRRRQPNLLMMSTMDLFARAFSSSLPPLKLLRILGLGLADKTGPIKNKVMKYAMGLSSTL